MSWRAVQWLVQSSHGIAGSYPLVTRGFSAWILRVLPVLTCFLWVLLCLHSTKYRHSRRGELVTVYFTLPDCECECPDSEKNFP